MKPFFLLIAIALFSAPAIAQDKYTNAMKSQISQIDSIRSKNNGVDIANTFERIGKAEKDKWLPYYYAAYALLVQSMAESDLAKRDEMANRAIRLINDAVTVLGQENSETVALQSMAATAQLTVDPQNRYMTYGAEITRLLGMARSLDSTNPRPVLLQAQMLFFTPEQFGGGKKAAKPLFDKADELFNAFKPETELSPDWGRMELQYFLSQYQ